MVLLSIILSKVFRCSTKEKPNQGDYTEIPYQFVPIGREDDYSEIRFYDFDSTWCRWRRGYELYVITQQYLGSSATGRNTRETLECSLHSNISQVFLYL